MTTLYLSDSGLSLPVSLFPWKVEKTVVVEHRAGNLYAHPGHDYLLVRTTKLQYSHGELAAAFEGCEGIVVGDEAPSLVLGNLSLLPPVPVVSCLPELTYRLARERSVKPQPLTDGVALIPAPLPVKDALSVVVVAPQNAAGQGSAITKALQDHTPHAARFIQYENNFLEYDGSDLLLFDPPGTLDREAAEEALALVEDADFFHFIQLPPEDAFGWKQRANQNNAVIEYVGTDIVTHATQVCAWHKETGVMGISGWDWMMLTVPGLPFMPYHFPALYDVEGESAVPMWEKGTPFRICHPTTNRAFKGTQTFLDAVDSLVKRGVDIEAVVIEGKPHRECLEIKRSCHATFDQFHGIYGVSAIESMAMGHAVVGGVSSWARSFFLDSPVLPATPPTLTDVISALVDGGPEELLAHGEKALAYARKTHALDVGAQRLSYLYDHLRHGHRLLTA